MRALFSGFRPSDPEERVKFIWHGGEPFMIKLAYYEEIGRLQQSLLESHFHYWNTAQTNLTILTAAHIRFLKERRLFEEIGISFDVYGDQRVDIRGQSSTTRVLANMQTLIDNDITFGAITVLSQSTVDKIRAIYRFFDHMGVPFRVLPFHLETIEGQRESHGLTPASIANAMCDVFDEWLQSETATPVYPLHSYLDFAISHMKGNGLSCYDKDTEENVFVIDTDGSIYGIAETYSEKYRYGNIFEQTFEEILDSSTRRTHILEANARLESFCTTCPYFGGCPGFFVAEANPMEWEWLQQSGCYLREVLTHIISRLEKFGLDAIIHEKAQQRKASLLGLEVML